MGLYAQNHRKTSSEIYPPFHLFLATPLDMSFLHSCLHVLFERILDLHDYTPSKNYSPSTEWWNSTVYS